ncbi:MAG: hypothetical protein PHE55_08745 [Methylococcaceae bacterium]|nr:hypothetical protein [Methylococcaceae bacterium]
MTCSASAAVCNRNVLVFAEAEQLVITGDYQIGLRGDGQGQQHHSAACCRRKASFRMRSNIWGDHVDLEKEHTSFASRSARNPLRATKEHWVH